MAKIYLDTNCLIDFYRSRHEKVEVFREMHKHAANIVLTQQTVTEFRRNRVSTLKWASGQLKSALDAYRPHTTAVLETLPNHTTFIQTLENLKKHGTDLLKSLEELILDETKDPIAKEFLSLTASREITNLKLTDEAIKHAQQRKLLGNPPCSPDKYSIGDEVIWEILTANLKEDLIVVTRDQTYHENLSLLFEEYQAKTGAKLVLVTERISEALKKIGKEPTKELIDEEAKLEKVLLPMDWITPFSGRENDSIFRQRRSSRNATLIELLTGVTAPAGIFPPPQSETGEV